MQIRGSNSTGSTVTRRSHILIALASLFGNQTIKDLPSLCHRNRSGSFGTSLESASPATIREVHNITGTSVLKGSMINLIARTLTEIKTSGINHSSRSSHFLFLGRYLLQLYRVQIK
jgi:hypothetical protein